MIKESNSNSAENDFVQLNESEQQVAVRIIEDQLSLWDNDYEKFALHQFPRQIITEFFRNQSPMISINQSRFESR